MTANLITPKKRFGAEQIVTLLRQIEVSMEQTVERRNLLQFEESASRRRAMVKTLQYRQTALSARISTASTTDDEPVPAAAT
jgi:hypothetical protein